MGSQVACHTVFRTIIWFHNTSRCITLSAGCSEKKRVDTDHGSLHTISHQPKGRSLIHASSSDGISHESCEDEALAVQLERERGSKNVPVDDKARELVGRGKRWYTELY